MINRRKETRVVEKNHVLIDPPADREGCPVINAYTFDISTGGARICSHQFFNVGSVIKLQVELARSHQMIQLEAEVKWFRMKEVENVFEFGVEFRHRMTTTLLALIRHLYQPDEKIPLSMSM